jgi:IS30 family transposase
MQQTQQWTAAYLQASEQAEPFLFNKVREIVRKMQDDGLLKPLIFHQLVMIIQTLKVMNAVPEETFQIRVKKIFALLYHENDTCTKLVEQVTQQIEQTKQHVQNRGFQAVQPNRQVKRGPPAGQSIF